MERLEDRIPLAGDLPPVGVLLREFSNPDPSADDSFGLVIASSESKVLIGAPFGDGGATDAGAAYLFDKAGNLLQTFANPTPNADDRFGRKVAFVGNNVLIGAPFDDDAGATNAGAAYLFDPSGTLLQTFVSPTVDAGDLFGGSLAQVGSNIVIGARLDDTSAANAGAAYVFDTSGTLLQTILNPTPGAGDQFGTAITEVGSNVVISARLDDTGATNTGAAYLFDTSGNLLQTFLNPTPDANDFFGRSIAVVDGKILISAHRDDSGAVDAGAAHLFDTSGNLLHTFLNPNPDANDLFANTVAAVGDKILIGAPFDDTGATNAGVAYLFDTSGNALQTFLNPTPDADDRFGSVDGVKDSLLIGAAGGGPFDEGIVYMFDVAPTIAAQSFDVDENQTSVGTIVADDPDLPGDSLLFEITGDGADDASFSILPTGELTFDTPPDFENPTDAGTDNVYDVQVKVTDSGGLTAVQNITVTVIDVNEAPTVVHPIADVTALEDDPDLTIDLSDVFEDVDFGDMLTLSVSDNTNTTLVTASIVGNDLLLDYQADQNGIATITVRATDAQGLFAEDSLTVTVLSAVDQIEDLIEDIGDLDVNGGQQDALTSKLNNAVSKLEQGDTTGGINMIQAFINQLNALVDSGQLTESEVAVLIDAANAAIASATPESASLVTNGAAPSLASNTSRADLLLDEPTMSVIDVDDRLLTIDSRSALVANSITGISPSGHWSDDTLAWNRPQLLDSVFKDVDELIR